MIRPLLAGLCLCLAGAGAPAHAQLLPGGLPRLPDPLPGATQPVLDTGREALSRVRVQRIDALLREHRQWLDRDPDGQPVVRGEVLALDPSPEALERARAAGYRVAGRQSLAPLGIEAVRLQAPEGRSTRRALRQLRRWDPEGSYDYNHLYLGSALSMRPDDGADTAPRAATTPPTDAAGGWRVGLVDGGVDAGHPALAGTTLHAWGCGGGTAADDHGTAVASLLARAGDGPGTLYSADIYCGQPTGGAVSGLAEALAWLARERVRVINLSLVGPDNRLLARLVQALQARGHVLVAAVGNDGPAAPPLYPAAYPGVLGVTAVDARGRALPEAASGPQVDVAAAGLDLPAARPGGGWARVRGTSFAAPLVARRLADHATTAADAPAGQWLDWLRAQAVDAGRPGVDPRYGWGIVAVAVKED